jgi:hypothetical protein
MRDGEDDGMRRKRTKSAHEQVRTAARSKATSDTVRDVARDLSDAEQRVVLARAVRVECAAIRARNRQNTFAESCADSAPEATAADSPCTAWGGAVGYAREDSAWIRLLCSG